MNEILESKSQLKTIHVSAAVILKEENGTKKIFATERGYGEWKDWWEFPGGKIEEGETAKDAIIREIKEELNTTIKPIQHLCTVEYTYPKFHLVMECFLCQIQEGSLTLLEHENAAWLSRGELESVKWLPADVEVLNYVKDLLSEDIQC